jgi:hypothetical protein
MDSARIIEVIETVSAVGEGTMEDPARSITRYWTKDGNLLWTSDPWKEHESVNAAPIQKGGGSGSLDLVDPQ